MIIKKALHFFSLPINKKYKDVLVRLSDLDTRLSNLEMAVDCLIEHPSWVDSKEIGFNWQRQRKLIFRDLLKTFNFEAIIETGTWIGHTTGYMANATKLPVFTCEMNKRFYSLAKMRLQNFPNITLEHGDSRYFLKKLANKNLSTKIVFIYLDSHWYDDLPLREEIEIICNGWKNFILMIDDFQVPGDNGYGYDVCGIDKPLSYEFISDIMAKYQLIPFFPAFPSSEENGGKRGCIILTKKGGFSEKLTKVQSLCTKDYG
jgi:hypothetical protein